MASKVEEWIEAYLPEGKYRIRVGSDPAIANATRARGLERTITDLEVTPGEGTFVLPAIRGKATLEERLLGKAAPEIDARGLDGKPVRLADYKGKIVVLYFWNYQAQCGGSTTDLIEAHRRFRSLDKDSESVVFLALHDQSIQSREDYDKKLDPAKRALWEGHDLPLPVALDTPDPNFKPGDPQTGMGEGLGLSAKRYEIRGSSTTFVIDRDGKLVGKPPR
jgi:hypothetical protein